MTPEAITLADIQKARQRVTPCVRRTPQVISATLCEQFKTNVYCKLELFQKTGSFKVRGAFNKILSLPPEVRNTGLVAISGGNHGLAVAYAARALDLKGLVLMPETAPQHYIDAARGYGAEVDFAKTASEAFSQVEELQRAGWHFLHPFDDPDIMAGQGTIGLEILEDTPQVTDVIVNPDLPTRRLVAAGCSIEYCLVYYERGGKGHTWLVALFHWTPEATRFEWGGIGPGGLATIDDVRKAVLTGAIKGPAAGW